MELIEPDSFILVYRDRKRHWIVKPRETPRLHTHLGILDCEALVGKEYGARVKTSVNDELVILKPTLEDMIMKFSRSTQVIYPKDLAPILLRFGLHSGSRVFEAGTGSGAATAAMAYLVMKEGRVYTYDVNEKAQQVARRNLERLGVAEYVTFKPTDAKNGIEERELDAALVDMGDPWEMVSGVREALKPSGVLAAVTPTTNQAERLVARMREESFVRIETMEVLIRALEAREGMTRPSHFMVGHTAYLTFGTKATPENPPE